MWTTKGIKAKQINGAILGSLFSPGIKNNLLNICNGYEYIVLVNIVNWTDNNNNNHKRG